MSAIENAPPQPPPTRQRLTPDDPDYTRLHATTRRRLEASVRTFARDLRQRGARELTQIQSAFIHRHTEALARAYIEGQHAGQRDYWQGVSLRARHTLGDVDAQQMRRRMAFYAPSVAKLAAEGARAWQTWQASRSAVQASESEPHTERLYLLASTGNAKNSGDALDAWQNGLGARLTLQAEITWSGLNDGYLAGGVIDPASPYAQVWWVLGPVKTEHCDDCLRFAADSPYGRPGSGEHELYATPADGSTECGAACHCHLDYVPPYLSEGSEQNVAQESEPLALERMAAYYHARGYPLAPGNFLLEYPNTADLTDGQKQALDLYRATWMAWDEARTQGNLPPMPRLFADAGDFQELLWPAWDALTDKQRQLLQQVFEAMALWAAATNGGNGNGAGQQFSDADAMLLEDPAHDPHSGKFAPYGNHGVEEHESGGGGGGAGRGAHGHGHDHEAHSHGAETPTRHARPFDMMSSSVVRAAEDAQAAGGRGAPEHTAFGRGHDPWMERTMHELGTDGPADRVPESRLGELLARGDVELWRGFHTPGHAEQFRTGAVYTAIGNSGSGIYVAHGPGGRREAVNYQNIHGVGHGELMHLTLKADARVVTYAQLHEEWMHEMMRAGDEIVSAQRRGDGAAAARWHAYEGLIMNHGRFAAIRGYDAVLIKEQMLPEYLVVNRTALRVLIPGPGGQPS